MGPLDLFEQMPETGGGQCASACPCAAVATKRSGGNQAKRSPVALARLRGKDTTALECWPERTDHCQPRTAPAG